MTRIYTNAGLIYKHGLIMDRVREAFVLKWDKKNHKHHFFYYGFPVENKFTDVTFESLEHEREFLDFHPDAACMRTVYKYGYFYHHTTIQAFNDDTLPFEFRRNRWCWKKT